MAQNDKKVGRFVNTMVCSNTGVFAGLSGAWVGCRYGSVQHVSL
jgi:hypothetical protein